MIKNLILCALLFCVGVANEKFYNELFIYYGAKYQVPPMLLWAIAKTESNVNANAKNINKNGSIDIGLMKINSIHENTLKHNNLSLKDLYNPSVNIQMGAFILKSCIDKYQISNNALNCYNGKIKDNHYAFKVIKNLRVKQGQIIK